MKRKKKNCKGDWLAYCPFFSKCESQYNKLYCDTGLDKQGLGDGPRRAAGTQGRARGAHGRPRYGRLGHDTAHDTAKGGATWLGVSVSQYNRCIVTGARAWLAGNGSRYNQLYRERRAAWPLRRVTIQSLVS